MNDKPFDKRFQDRIEKKAQPDVDEDGNCVECGYELARCKCGTHPDPLGRPERGDGFHKEDER